MSAFVELPHWAHLEERRLSHLDGVATLVSSWADRMGVTDAERARWNRAVSLHDALKDAPKELLDELAYDWWDVPGLRHGPAAAVLAERYGEDDDGVLDAVRYHSVGYAGWEMVGKVLFLADYLEPGRESHTEAHDVFSERVPTEIIPIKNRLNELLSRLEASFDRERRFSADVAHELRTPLAGIRSTIEVTLAHARDANQYKKALSDCLAIVEVMQTMVNNLLMIARLDACQVTFRQEEIRLAELANFCWRSFSERAIQRSIILENRINAEITCRTDCDSLSMVLSNLLDNAVEYANEEGRIWTTAQQVGDCMEVTVANTGCTLTNEQVSQVFDCFWRGDSSRKDAGVHCGLGLALVQKIIRALGGSVTAEIQNGGIFNIQITFPVKNDTPSGKK